MKSQLAVQRLQLRTKLKSLVEEYDMVKDPEIVDPEIVEAARSLLINWEIRRQRLRLVK